MANWTLHCDGACEPRNPGGWMAAAFIVKSDQGHRHSDCVVVKPSDANSNNRAEYGGVILGLEYLRQYVMLGGSKGELAIYADSQLLVNQLNGEWACNKQHLRDLRDKCYGFLEGWDWRATWIPREQNTEADALTKKSLAAQGVVAPDRSQWKRR